MDKEEFINAGFNVSELKDLSELTKADGAFDLPDMIETNDFKSEASPRDDRRRL